MAESDPSDNLLELQPFKENIGLGQLEIVRALIESGVNVELHFHNTVHHNTVVEGDVVRGSKTDVKDSEFQTLSVSNEERCPPGPSQPQALPEPLIQDALSGADREERDAEGNATQTNMPDTFDTESQTDKKSYREKMAQTNEDIRFDTEAQTDNPRTRDRILQTDTYVTDSDSQTLSTIWQRTSDTDVQTEILEQSTNQTQTEIKSYQENEFQTDEVKILDVNSQTNKQALLEIHPAIMKGLAAVTPDDDKPALEMIEFFNNERTTQNVGNFLPLLNTIWESIRIKIILKSFVRQFAKSSIIQSQIQLDDTTEQNLLTFISRVYDVIKIAEQFASENNFIHAVISFYIAAKIHKLRKKIPSSVNGTRDCVLQVRFVVGEMVKQPGMKNIVIDHVIPMMHEMKSNIQSIQGSYNKWKYEAWCLWDIGLCYFHCGEYQQYANMSESAIVLIKREFGNKAEKYHIYGQCLHIAGVAYYMLEQFELSNEKFKMSLKAYKEANDWISYDEKNKAIADNEINLNTVLSKL